MPRAGPAAHSRPSDERTASVDAHGHAWVRLDTVDGSYWRNLDLQHSQWHPPWERVAVEAPQIQFIDALVFEQFQFLDKFMVGSLLCNDSCRCSLECRTLTVSMYLRDAVAGPLHGALLRNAWLDSVCLFLRQLLVLWVYCCSFLREGESVLVVVSVLLSWLGLRNTLIGEVCTDEFAVAYRASGHTWNLDCISPSPLFLHCCVRWSSVA